MSTLTVFKVIKIKNSAAHISRKYMGAHTDIESKLRNVKPKLFHCFDKTRLANTNSNCEINNTVYPFTDGEKNFKIEIRDRN